MTLAASLVAIAATGSTVLAQTASLRWEARLPGGAWQDGIIATTAQQTLEIRLVASWDAPGATGATSLYMDALVKDAAFDDSVINPVRVPPFNARPQTIAARRVVQGIKIDDNADLAEVGASAMSLILLQLR